MHQRMLVLSQQLLLRPPHHLRGRWIDEGDIPVHVHTVDALARRVEYQLQLPPGLLVGILRLFALGNVLQDLDGPDQRALPVPDGSGADGDVMAGAGRVAVPSLRLHAAGDQIGVLVLAVVAGQCAEIVVKQQVGQKRPFGIVEYPPELVGAHHLGCLDPGQRTHCVVPDDDAVLVVQHEGRDGGVEHQALRELLLGLQRRLGPLALGNVEHDPQKTAAGAIRSREGGLEDNDVALGKVGTPCFRFLNLHAPLVQQIEVRPVVGVGQVARGYLEDGLPYDVLAVAGIAVVIEERLVAPEVPSLDVIVIDRYRGDVDEDPGEVELPLHLAFLIIQFFEKLVESIA